MHCHIQPRKTKGNSGGEHEQTLFSGKEAQKDKFTFEEEITSWKDTFEYAQNKVGFTNIVEFSLVLQKSNPTSSPIVLHNSTKTLTKSNLMDFSINAFFPLKTTNPKYKISKPAYAKAFQTTLMKASSNTLQAR